MPTRNRILPDVDASGACHCPRITKCESQWLFVGRCTSEIIVHVHVALNERTRKQLEHAAHRQAGRALYCHLSLRIITDSLLLLLLQLTVPKKRCVTTNIVALRDDKCAVVVVGNCGGGSILQRPSEVGAGPALLWRFFFTDNLRFRRCGVPAARTPAARGLEPPATATISIIATANSTTSEHVATPILVMIEGAPPGSCVRTAITSPEHNVPVVAPMYSAL